MRANKDLFGNIGIDSVGFCAPRYYINLEDLTNYNTKSLDLIDWTPYYILNKYSY